MVRTPKFIETPEPKKVVYSWRIEDNKLNKLQELAKLTEVTTPDLLNNIIDSYLEDKIVYNHYLESYKNYYMLLPVNLSIKEYLTNKNIFSNVLTYDFKEYKDLYNNILDIDTDFIDLEFNNYKIQRIPNNLDVFNKNNLSYYTNITDSIKTHSGIELYIEPDIAQITDDYTNCLYCFYFNVKEDEVIISIIPYNDALRLLNIVNNSELIAITETIINKLAKAKNIRSVKKIAKDWNTNNIIKLKDVDEDKATPYKIEITKDNTIIKPYDKDLDDTIKTLKREVKEQTTINKVLINEIESLKKENNELKEIKNKLDTAIANTQERMKKENEEMVKNILNEYGL